MNVKKMVIPVVIGALYTVTNGLVQRLKDFKIRKYSIIKIGQNTEKRPGDMRRLAAAQTPMRSHQPNLWEKHSKEYPS